jgi:hypothetical protein
MTMSIQWMAWLSGVLPNDEGLRLPAVEVRGSALPVVRSMCDL